MDAIKNDLIARVNPGRVKTFNYRFAAVGHLYQRVFGRIYRSLEERRATLAEWNAARTITLEERVWSQKQQKVLDTIRNGLGIADANLHHDDNR